MQYLSGMQKEHAVRSGEIVIEIDEERLEIIEDLMATDLYDPLNPDKMKLVKREQITGNRNLQFGPVETRSRKGGPSYNFIRSRRVLMRDGEDARFNMDPALRQIDYIGGERIHIDFENKKGRITDSIFDPENDSVYQKMKEIGVKIHGVSRPFVSGIYFEKDLSDPFALWNWAWHMRRIMDGNEEHNGGPERHRGCSTSGPRLCRPVQNVDQMPTMLEILRTGKVKVPLGPMTKEMQDDFDASRKEHDPDFKPMDRLRSETILTPYLAGVAAE